MTKKDFRLLVFFVLFVGLGLWGLFFYSYVEDSKAFRMAAIWFGIPSIMLGGYYAYYNVFTRGPQQAHWKKVAAVMALGIFAISIFIASFAGFIIFWNSHVGSQREKLIQGQVINVKAPQRKKMLTSYTISIQDSLNNITDLKVPGENYSVGDTFSHLLTRGSLGLLYSR